MDQVLLLKIESLHARLVPETGIKIRYKRRELTTGVVSAILDETAVPPANLGMLNLTAGTIHLSWRIVATLPFLADVSAAGLLPEKETAPLKINFEEIGNVLEDDSGFDAVGGGSIEPGTPFSGVKITIQSNYARTFPPRKVPLAETLASGKSVRCVLTPDSYLDFKLTPSLGGGTQRANLIGSFALVPLMLLGRNAAKRSRR
jgi:hypothetical protein